MKELDELILNASESQLKKFQELDTRTQLDGASFYDVFSKNGKQMAMTSDPHQLKKKRK